MSAQTLQANLLNDLAQLPSDVARRILSRRYAPGQIIELRVPGVTQGELADKVTYGGLYTDQERLIQDIRFLIEKTDAPAIYTGLQQIKSDDPYQKACTNSLSWSQQGASAEDIEHYRWLLIDVDTIRPKEFVDSCSTDAEKAEAFKVTEQIVQYLRSLGIDPDLIDSGNSYHIVAAIDLQATEQNELLVKAVLEGLAAKFDNAHAKVDTAVCDRARICKLPGTYVRKGVNTVERPHRWSGIISEGDQKPIALQTLLQIANLKEVPVEKACAPSLANDDGPILAGSRDITLASIAGRYRHKGLSVEEIRTLLAGVNEKRCQPPVSEADLDRIAGSIGRYKPGEPTVYVGGVPAGTAQPAPAAAPVAPAGAAAPLVLLSNGETTFYGDMELAMTPTEFETEMDKDWPVLALVTPAGPSWDDDILYGLAGKIIKKAAQYSESHPVGMYIDLLVAYGNLLGRSAYFTINQTRHYTNEFFARVGHTSRARKGGGRDTIDFILGLVAPDWIKSRVIRGFGSPQAIINEIRDSKESNIYNKKKGEFEAKVEPGVDDKRLCIREDELANIFQLANMRDSRADVFLRDAWDGKALQNNVRGKTQEGFSNSLCCQEPHVSISADTTNSELIRKMPNGSDENGFGNRFLYGYVYRMKLCPCGGPEMNWDEETVELSSAIGFGQKRRYVGLSKAAEKMWRRMYLDLESNQPAGLAGKMTARGPAHVRRLALILALLDECEQVESRHLQAARRLWDYCEQSAEFIFSGCTKDQRRILSWIEAHCVSGEPATVTQIRDDLFKRNQKVAWIRAQVNELARQGFLTIQGEQIRPRKR